MGSGQRKGLKEDDHPLAIIDKRGGFPTSTPTPPSALTRPSHLTASGPPRDETRSAPYVPRASRRSTFLPPTHPHLPPSVPPSPPSHPPTQPLRTCVFFISIARSLAWLRISWVFSVGVMDIDIALLAARVKVEACWVVVWCVLLACLFVFACPKACLLLCV